MSKWTCCLLLIVLVHLSYAEYPDDDERIKLLRDYFAQISAANQARISVQSVGYRQSSTTEPLPESTSTTVAQEPQSTTPTINNPKLLVDPSNNRLSAEEQAIYLASSTSVHDQYVVENQRENSENHQSLSEFSKDQETQASSAENRRPDTARHLSDRQSMQSLVHLIPTNLWNQLQNNNTINHQNQSYINRPSLPDPVLLAEAAAQAGLPGPGPYPIPDHLWPFNSGSIKTRATIAPLITRPTMQSQTLRTTFRTMSLSPAKTEPPVYSIHSLLSQIGLSCPTGSSGVRFPDKRLCNMYFTCTPSGLPEPSLCPEGYLFSEAIRDCDLAGRVNCGTRLSNFFEMEDTRGPFGSNPMTSNQRLNGTDGKIECVLGSDGYFEDPQFCNVYHHCLAGMDYVEYCPNQLAWNDKKKMCDWTSNVNCSGKTMPVPQSKTSFCTNRPDGRYASEAYCNVFHHCIGGTDHLVRCTGELQWDDKKKECGWESSVHCGAPKTMLPSETISNSTFCSGKPDGAYPNEEYCNVYHVCESGTDQIRQCPHQLFWDQEQQKCEWSNKVRCTGRTLVALSMESTVFCSEKPDGFYSDPKHCNVYHQCLADIDVKLRCPERLIFNETLKRCDWPETTQCKSGNILIEEDDKPGFCTDKPNGNFAHEQYCNRYYICQNGKDVVFTCQNNLRYSIEKNECDWAVNVDCKGKPDYMWEGIKENFCKRLPDGNYPDARYCNIFHQCQAAMDYRKSCPNRLMFNEATKECDWEDQVDCKGREKFIDTDGLDDAVRPGSNTTRGRSTKFCMTRENGDYADQFYCNVYHNCHGGFDTIQYCTHGLVWRQEAEAGGRCDWSKERSADGVDCNGKSLFFVDKLGETDILSNLRSEFCISKGQGLYEHQQYCDLYVQCNEQGVAVTMECSPGLMFNDKKKECDYQSENDDENKNICSNPRTFLRSKPKSSQASILFEGLDATGQFPTRFDCSNKNPQIMLGDFDWCNIYHVCVGSRDNIFLCPPGTIFNETKQGCMDRFDGTNCNGTRSYFKPTMRRQKRDLDLSEPIKIAPRQSLYPIVEEKVLDEKEKSQRESIFDQSIRKQKRRRRSLRQK